MLKLEHTGSREPATGIDADVGEREGSVYSGLTVEQENKYLEVGEGQCRG